MEKISTTGNESQIKEMSERISKGIIEEFTDADDIATVINGVKQIVKGHFSDILKCKEKEFEKAKLNAEFLNSM